MDLQSTEPVQGIVGGNASSSALSKQFNAGINALAVGASESKEESDEMSQVTSTTNEASCVACDDADPSCQYCLPTTCKHTYCKMCLKKWLELATEDESYLPLRCCKQDLPMDFVTMCAKRLLSSEWATRLLSALQESMCKNKMYCPVASCSTFIDLDAVASTLDMNMTFCCRRCGTAICFDCKTTMHDPSISCAANQKMSMVSDEAALRSMGFQQCKGCKRFLELTYGCNHMTCRCKFEFCYVCGEKWKTCLCEVTDQDRLLLEQEGLVPRNIVGEQRARAVAERMREANAVINAEENCLHRRVRRTDDYAFRRNKPKCRQCSRRLNQFGYVCDGCSMKMCIACHLHR